MTDQEIIALYFARDEQAITETDRQYGTTCMRTAMRILAVSLRSMIPRLRPKVFTYKAAVIM